MARDKKNNIDVMNINSLSCYNFFIPNYQRGYRWGENEAISLLEDLEEFSSNKKNAGEFYCLQPVVVKKKDWNDAKGNKISGYEVIDGQQRLTTIYILLKYFEEKIKVLYEDFKFYSIYYETRMQPKSDSKAFLENIKSESSDNLKIDFAYMKKVYITIEKWMENKSSQNRNALLECLLKIEPDKNNKENDLANNLRVIWYETNESDSIKIFTRLNIGKIPLTNSELIKALFLNQANFKVNNDPNKISLYQQEIAAEWDRIEYSLQNEEFWLFIHDNDYKNPTRIDFIFDLIFEKDIFIIKNSSEFFGNDRYKTFRYFYNFFKQNKDIINEDFLRDEIWSKVKEIYKIFEEWYNDVKLYHYVGFLIDQGDKVSNLYDLWNDSVSKEDFVEKLIKKIKGKIEKCNNLNRDYYENKNDESTDRKTDCKPLLLLHNIQTVVEQNNAQKNGYNGLAIFYKFPFHLYKKENWDIEHIDSATTNELVEKKDQDFWLKSVQPFVCDEYKNKINEYLQKDDHSDFEAFSQEISDKNPELSLITHEENFEKNKIWNYTLLDSSTNRSYGNSIFAYKRKCVIEKDTGIHENNYSAIAFIPPCTRNVFTKYYTKQPSNLLNWNSVDATFYVNDIYEKLKNFGVIKFNENEEA